MSLFLNRYIFFAASYLFLYLLHFLRVKFQGLFNVFVFLGDKDKKTDPGERFEIIVGVLMMHDF